MTLAEFFKIQLVWGKGLVVAGYDSAHFRKDDFGYWIKKSDYGNRKSQYGWEIDHIVPESKNGSDAFSNLRPLHWRVNASRQDGRF